MAFVKLTMKWLLMQFFQLIQQKEQENNISNLIHPTSIVEESAELGANVKIGPFLTIQENVKIGDIQTGLSKKSLFWLLIGLFASLVLVTVFYIVGKRRCPECGSRLHVNIRPLYRTDSPYKRIKIIKCFDCNYFRKYLFQISFIQFLKPRLNYFVFLAIKLQQNSGSFVS